MKKGCLGRFVVFLLVLGCAGLGYEDYSLYQDKIDLQGQLAAANAKLDQMRVDKLSAHSSVAGKPAPQPASDDWLNQAQNHIAKANDALKAVDLTQALQEYKAAGQALEAPPQHMSAEMRARYDSLQKQLAGIKDNATSKFNNFVGG